MANRSRHGQRRAEPPLACQRAQNVDVSTYFLWSETHGNDYFMTLFGDGSLLGSGLSGDRFEIF